MMKAKRFLSWTVTKGVVKLKVKMTPPRMDEVEVTVPDDARTTAAIPQAEVA